MQNHEIMMLENTLKIFEKGYYELNGRRVPLKLSEQEQRGVKVFLPDHSPSYYAEDRQYRFFIRRSCRYSCENTDSFSMARKRLSSSLISPNKKEILVLNFANPVHPGGGVRRGAIAQEEDLCRKSSLLLSLESKEAERYYAYNKRLKTNMGSDAIIVTPKVEIIKDKNGNLLDETVVVAVMTCAAPMIRYGYEGLSEEEYRTMFYNRIMAMLRCAEELGYEHLVLGAFGCGVFGNDAKVVSDLFHRAIDIFNHLSYSFEREVFSTVDFAVLSPPENQYNFKEFYRNFGADNYYKQKRKHVEELCLEQKNRRFKYLDKIRGSLIGGAAGDALGYPVEFLRVEQIYRKYGKKGIIEYDLVDNVAQISDDTQMTLFTANGILVEETRAVMGSAVNFPTENVLNSYQNWLITQEKSFEQGKNTSRHYRNKGVSWLLDVPELYARRAPEKTCLSALEERQYNFYNDFLDFPINDSKSCGALTRIAPLGLHDEPRFNVD